MAKITKRGGFYWVTWTRVGNERRPEPRGYRTAVEAEWFCHEHGLSL